MLPKPSSCEGCPFYGDGWGFVPDESVDDADTLILMQNPGEEEEEQARPAVGPAGQMMNVKMLPRAGLRRGQVSIANTLRCRWLEPARGGPRRIDGVPHKATNKLPQGRALNQGVAHCMQAHFRLPVGLLRAARPLIIAQGALALKGLGLAVNITQWRGYLAPVPYRVDDS